MGLETLFHTFQTLAHPRLFRVDTYPDVYQKTTESTSSSKSRDSQRSNGIVLPPIPIFERQVLSSQTLHELRVACAAILKETGPSGEEYDAIINQPDPLQIYQKEVARVRSKAAATQQPAFVLGKPPKPKEKKSYSASHSSTPLPLNPPFVANPGATKSSSTLPLPERPDSSSKVEVSDRRPVKNPGLVGQDAVPANIRAATDSRPRTALDHAGFSATSSRSTSRTFMTNDPHRISTGRTSYAQTPADEKRDSNQLPRRAASSDAPRSLWEREMRQADFYNPNPDYSIPTLHHKLPPSRQSFRERSRSRSRAGSIAENIRDNIRDYIRPRPTADNSRVQSRSASRAESRYGSRPESRSESRSSSRPPSRGSTHSMGRSWLKNAATGLRRKGSWSSFRSNRPDEEETERPRGRDKGPDLNRSLPPLPGLDQYKEPKLHIAQLMAHVPQKSPPQKSPPQTAVQPQPLSPKPNTASHPGNVPNHPANTYPRSTSLAPGTAPQVVQSPRPRIPFSDDYPGDFSLGQPTSDDYMIPSEEIQSIKPEGQQAAVEKPQSSRTHDEHHDLGRPEGMSEEEWDRRREMELRRVVRDRMRHVGLLDDKFEERESQRMAAAKRAQNYREHQPRRSGDGRSDKRDSRDQDRRLQQRERDRAARKRMSGGRKEDTREQNTRSRTSHRDEPKHRSIRSPEPPKKGLKNRLSRLLHTSSHSSNNVGSSASSRVVVAN